MGKKLPDAGCVGRKRACAVEGMEQRCCAGLLLGAGQRELVWGGVPSTRVEARPWEEEGVACT
jgi:hypothetical protein